MARKKKQRLELTHGVNMREDELPNLIRETFAAQNVSFSLKGVVVHFTNALLRRALSKQADPPTTFRTEWSAVQKNDL